MHSPQTMCHLVNKVIAKASTIEETPSLPTQSIDSHARTNGFSVWCSSRTHNHQSSIASSESYYYQDLSRALPKIVAPSSVILLPPRTRYSNRESQLARRFPKAVHSPWTNSEDPKFRESFLRLRWRMANHWLQRSRQRLHLHVHSNSSQIPHRGIITFWKCFYQFPCSQHLRTPLKKFVINSHKSKLRKFLLCLKKGRNICSVRASPRHVEE